MAVSLPGLRRATRCDLAHTDCLRPCAQLPKKHFKGTPMMSSFTEPARPVFGLNAADWFFLIGGVALVGAFVFVP